MNKQAAIALLIDIEGGYVDNPADPGGATKYGVTQRSLDARRVIFPSPLPASVKDLSQDQSAALYALFEWAAICGDQLPPALACVMLSAAVNQGIATAVKALQAAVGVAEDGHIGRVTLAAVAHWRSSYRADQGLAEEFCARVAVRYAALNAAEAGFELGWMRRLLRVYTAACL